MTIASLELLAFYEAKQRLLKDRRFPIVKTILIAVQMQLTHVKFSPLTINILIALSISFLQLSSNNPFGDDDDTEKEEEKTNNRCSHILDMQILERIPALIQ